MNLWLRQALRVNKEKLQKMFIKNVNEIATKQTL